MDVFEWLAWLQDRDDLRWTAGRRLGRIRTEDAYFPIRRPKSNATVRWRTACPLSAVMGFDSSSVDAAKSLMNWPANWIEAVISAADCVEGYHPFIRQTLLAACRLPPEADGV